MPVRKKPFHMYSVFVSTPVSTTLVYFGSSEAAARTAFGRTVMSNPNAYQVEIRRDSQRWIRVSIERP
jgi:hypothetical protein